ncbi:zinc finger E-box-binding homeobox 2-like isoform X1 [Lethenteron reissneri]|uniref:zinc finger E-box-binding homeobox 2-like isoform X1 n=1 Tax=Lethenteron reissneri TaxID=7753 RepID=UPI002AB7B203|nr:zinc finger E-box-binding homeobox 2-like isoform X1 [Lethenteron reissneri]
MLRVLSMKQQPIMAEGPRCKRRKQANPKRKNVVSFENVVMRECDLEEDDDRLHIVEDVEDQEDEDDDDDGRVGMNDGQSETADGGGEPSPSQPAEMAPLVRRRGRRRKGSFNSDEKDHADHEDVKDQSDGLGLENLLLSQVEPAVPSEETQAGPHEAEKELEADAVEAEGEDEEAMVGGSPGATAPVEGTLAEFLQRHDTAIIYPEDPDEVSGGMPGTPETGVRDDNGTPDAFAGLLACPYCNRGYKRLSSLREHIRYRHERAINDTAGGLADSHKQQRAQSQSQSTGNRKFKCTECGKAFKYKHHLKEHFRIHSGEKPYECPNCKKRFSHSGSYSSHISSKKCIGALPANGRTHGGRAGASAQVSAACLSPSGSPAACSSPPSESARLVSTASAVTTASSDLHRGVQVKAEPVDYPNGDYRAMVVMASRGLSGLAPFLNGGIRAAHCLGVPHYVATATASGAKSGARKTPEVAYDPSLEKRNGDFRGSNGSGEMFKRENYSTTTTASPPHMSGGGSAAVVAKSAEDPARMEEDHENCTQSDAEETGRMTVKIKTEAAEPESHLPVTRERPCYACQFCSESFAGPIPLHQHERYLCKMNEEIKAVLQPSPPHSTCPTPKKKTKNSITSHTAGKALVGGCHVPTIDDQLALLKSYLYARNIEPSPEELIKISLAMSLPGDLLRQWMDKKGPVTDAVPSYCTSGSSPSYNIQEASQSHSPARQGVGSRGSSPLQRSGMFLPSSDGIPAATAPTSSPHGGSACVRNGHPNGLTNGLQDQCEPLDLSVPKLSQVKRRGKESPPSHRLGGHGGEEQPLNLTTGTGVSKSVLNSFHSLKTSPSHSTDDLPENKPVISVASVASYAPGGQVFTGFPPPLGLMPTLHMGFPGLGHYGGMDTGSFLPRIPPYGGLAEAASLTDGQDRRGLQRRHLTQADSPEEGMGSPLGSDEVTDSESGLSVRKRQKKGESALGGSYSCDLCDKTFHKSSSLLRHKYEHTGKRPHQCDVCNKAFKHKHHLIEHSRLHSGEKPYQCDRCGKRFSHSGSYSQHMNHRYSYCRRGEGDRDGEPSIMGLERSIMGEERSMLGEEQGIVGEELGIRGAQEDASVVEDADKGAVGQEESMMEEEGGEEGSATENGSKCSQEEEAWGEEEEQCAKVNDYERRGFEDAADEEAEEKCSEAAAEEERAGNEDEEMELSGELDRGIQVGQTQIKCEDDDDDDDEDDEEDASSSLGASR